MHMFWELSDIFDVPSGGDVGAEYVVYLLGPRPLVAGNPTPLCVKSGGPKRCHFTLPPPPLPVSHPFRVRSSSLSGSPSASWNHQPFVTYSIVAGQRGLEGSDRFREEGDGSAGESEGGWFCRAEGKILWRSGLEVAPK